MQIQYRSREGARIRISAPISTSRLTAHDMRLVADLLYDAAGDRASRLPSDPQLESRLYMLADRFLALAADLPVDLPPAIA